MKLFMLLSVSLLLIGCGGDKKSNSEDSVGGEVVQSFRALSDNGNHYSVATIDDAGHCPNRTRGHGVRITTLASFSTTRDRNRNYEVEFIGEACVRDSMPDQATHVAELVSLTSEINDVLTDDHNFYLYCIDHNSVSGSCHYAALMALGVSADGVAERRGTAYLLVKCEEPRTGLVENAFQYYLTTEARSNATPSEALVAFSSIVVDRPACH